MIEKIYFDKDNVIYHNNSVNTGLNPIGEIVSEQNGNCLSYSRYIFHFDVEQIKEKYLNCQIDLDKAKFEIEIKGTGSVNNCSPRINLDSKVLLFKINQEWSEGCGYDYNCSNNCSDIVSSKCVYSESPSNWFYAKEGEKWNECGIYNTQEYILNIDVVENLPQSNANCFCLDGLVICQDTTPTTNIEGDPCTLTPRIDCTEVFTGSTEIILDASDCYLQPNLTYNETYAISASTEIIDCIEVPCNDYCGFLFDITDEIKNIITGDTVNYGYGIAFTPEHELSGNGGLEFYTRHTTTIFKPSLNIHYNNPIIDNRYDFDPMGVNRLYLKSRYQLDELPIVNILNSECEILLTLTANCHSEYYYVEFDGQELGEILDDIFIDEWSNLIYNGKTLDVVQNQFNIVPTLMFNTAYQQETEYWVGMSGIKNKERLKCGEKRRLKFNIRPKNKKCDPSQIKHAEFKLYTMEGVCDINIIDWCPINRDGCNFWIDIDTSWLLSTTYWIDVKIYTEHNVYTHCNKREFSVYCENNCC